MNRLPEDSSKIEWDNIFNCISDGHNPSFLLDYVEETFPTYDSLCDEGRLGRLSANEILGLITGMSEGNGLNAHACRLDIRHELIMLGKSGGDLDRLTEEGYQYALQDYVGYMARKFHRIQEILCFGKNQGIESEQKVEEVREGMEKLFILLGSDFSLTKLPTQKSQTIGFPEKISNIINILLRRNS